MIDLSTLDEHVKDILYSNGFSSIPFAALAERIATEGVDLDRNQLTCPVEMAPDDSIISLPKIGSAEEQHLFKIGLAAIEAGRVGVVVLNGGMATRFGGVVKGTVPAIDGRSFLDLKLSQTANIGKGRAPVLLMNSFATSDATKAHLENFKIGCEVRHFSQMASLRLTKRGDIFWTANGMPSLHAPGHGDLPFALRQSGELKRFIKNGGKMLMVSNVDNLGASLSPLVIGAHIAGGKPMTTELVENRGDVGGSPALVNGRVVIVETFRMPKSFTRHIPTFNVNTFTFDAEALDRPMELSWFTVVKKVEGQEALQFERLIGQLTEILDSTFLLVPRDGPSSRFLPVKTPEDLEKQTTTLRAALEYQGVV